MHWTTVCILVGFILVFYWLKHRGQISAKEARAHLSNGALLVDVRTPAEFNCETFTRCNEFPAGSN